MSHRVALSGHTRISFGSRPLVSLGVNTKPREEISKDQLAPADNEIGGREINPNRF
jgi:hypothetical protein